MIKRSLIVAIIIFILYNLVLQLKPNLFVSQSQWQDNAIKAERFVSSEATFDNVIVGSSLSSRLPQDSLLDFYNLSFSGLSIFDGLAILCASNKKPKRVFIETNVILKLADKSFVKSFTNNRINQIRGEVKSMQNGKQPLAFASLVMGVIMDASIFKIKSKWKRVRSDSEQQGQLKGSKGLLQEMINEQIKQTETNTLKFEKEGVAKYFELLNFYVHRLEQQHIRVIFFEMPISAQLNNLRGPEQLRKKLLSEFPPDKYQIIQQPDCALYQTTDGIHLTTQDAILYLKYFKENICIEPVTSTLPSP